MAGWLTNTMTILGALINNGTTADPVPLTNVGSQMLIPVDTETARGAQPQTAAVPLPMAAAFAAEFIYSSATSTANAATLARNGGVILTEALTTAVGSTYTMTHTNSLVAAADPPMEVAMVDGTNTGGQAILQSVSMAAGSAVYIFKNVGSAAFNGTKVIAFHRQIP